MAKVPEARRLCAAQGMDARSFELPVHHYSAARTASMLVCVAMPISVFSHPAAEKSSIRIKIRMNEFLKKPMVKNQTAPPAGTYVFSFYGDIRPFMAERRGAAGFLFPR